MNRTLALAALVVSAVTGCSGPCAPRAGTYSWQLKARSGDCGDGQEMIFTVTDEPTRPAPPCTGTITYSADNCEVTHDEACPVAADGGMDEGTFKLLGVVHWNGAATAGNGEFEYDLMSPNAELSCQGTYDATYQKLN
jgi:hypothetical protein